MKKILLFLFILTGISYSQTVFVDSLNGQTIYPRVGTWNGKSANGGVAPMPVQISGSVLSGTTMDTVVTVTTTPKRLDSLFSSATIATRNIPIRAIYIQNNQSGASVYVGNTYTVLETGFVIFYGEMFADGINYFRKMSDVVLVASTSSNVRIKLIY